MSEAGATREAISAAWRVESARLMGALARLVRDLDLAEDLAQEALVAALETWPTTGIPDNPGAWLMATAKNRAIDRARKQRLVEHKHGAMSDELAGAPPKPPDIETAIDEDVGDDLLRLILISCHPVLPTEGRVALTLRLLGGLTTDEIARAFLVPEPTVAQRIVRAKRTLAEARVPFELPRGPELAARLPSVLEVVYLIFNEGYAATRGGAWIRSDLCEDALRLGRMLAGHVPDVAEAHGLVALMELQASRARARVDASGQPILLLDQDRSRWDLLLVNLGLQALARAESMAQPLGPYTLQAAIAACHARARRAADTDWKRIVALYDALVEMTGSPVVELNRAVAVGMAFGPAQGLELVDTLLEDPALRNYHLLPSVRGDLLAKLGRKDEARAEFERAAQMAQNTREKELLQARAKACEPGN
ncbi:MAG: RNA polymerase sigma factor [Deltaproteobacteria bacterium]|nr:RNA polymerase sigma factor [Deltaproteobacteria bacterium]